MKSQCANDRFSALEKIPRISNGSGNKMSKNIVTRFKKKANGQILLDGSISLEGKNKVPTASRFAKAGFGLAGVATTALALTGCSPAVSTVAKPRPLKCVTVPPKGFASVTGLRMPRMLSPLPTVTGNDLSSFGGADCAQSAFTVAFAFLYKANQIPDLWTPNLNKDPNFLVKLENDLKTLAPYLGGSLKKDFLASIPKLVDPLASKEAKASAGMWRGLFMIPDRLTNGTLPPASTKSDDLEAVAPWDLGASASEPVATVGKLPEYGKTPVLALDFKWTSNLVFGTTTRIKYFDPLNRDMRIYVVANPNAGEDKASPYLIVGYSWNSKAKFGKMTPYDKPLAAKAPN